MADPKPTTSENKDEKTSNPERLQQTLKRLLALARPEIKTLSIGTLFLVLGTGMSLLYPQAIRVIMEAALDPKKGEKNLIDIAALSMTAIFLVQGIAIAFRSYLFTVSGERIVTRLRQDLYGRIIRQEIGFFDQRRTGELINRLASDTTVLQNTVSVNISMALRFFASTIGAIGLLLYTSPILTGLMIIVVPPVALGAVFFGRTIRRLSRDAQDALAKASEVAEETIGGIRTVRVYSHEAQENERYNEAVEESFQIARKRARSTALFSGSASFAAYSAIAVVLWYGGHLVIDKQMTVGDLTSFILYTLMLAFSLGALGGLWADFMRASGAGERVFSLLDRVPQIAVEEGKTLETVQGEMLFQDVRFAYPSRPDVEVLKGLQLELFKGQVVALVGPSGGGKSTVASLMTRLYDPLQGSIKLDGHDLRDLNASWLREQIGVVEQEPMLFSTTIGGNIRYGDPDATDEEVEAAAKAANAHDFIMRFPQGYQTEVGERGVQLSGGQKQRVAIARAVLKDPRLLILDEATSALDTESEALVKEALDRLMKGRTTLIIAHRLSTVKDANRVVVISDGQIAQQGTHQELLEQEGIYQRLIQKQFVGDERHEK
ncbi:MAG: ATP-binding cassette domain-containing protein [Myxococcales bacterium]|nr:ATP-binding cassette domain-containing protein [Myxococcales bacterium]